MPQLELSPAERKALKGDAHHLDPVVMIGADGLTDAVRKETDAALNAHGLIKIRVLGDDRAAREAIYAQLADELNAAWYIFLRHFLQLKFLLLMNLLHFHE